MTVPAELGLLCRTQTTFNPSESSLISSAGLTEITHQPFYTKLHIILFVSICYGDELSNRSTAANE